MLAVRIIRGIQEDCLYRIRRDHPLSEYAIRPRKGFMFSNRNEISTKSPSVQFVNFLTFGTRNRTSANRIPHGWGQSKRPGIAAEPFLLLCSERLDLEIHTTHAAHAAARRHAGAGVLLRHFGHHRSAADHA